MPRSELRAFKYHGTYFTTFEDPIHDPDPIKTVWNSDDKDANLFPDRLSLPLRRDTIQHSQPINKPYGYALCWSQPNFEWYPYLPAIVNFRYTLFRGMSTDPDIVYTSSGYKLEDDEIQSWRNVEYVLCTAISALQSGRIVPLGQTSPLPPSEYGYTLSHRQEKFARKCAMKSLNAFQRLLGYCSFLVASRTYRAVDLDHSEPHLESIFSSVFAKLDQTASSVHIMAKHLLWTLSEIRWARNFTGIVLRCTEQYSFPAVSAMYHYGVPVYVSWPSTGKNPYDTLHQGYYIKRWIPSPSLMASLERTPMLPPAIPPPHLAKPWRSVTQPSIRKEPVYSHPMDYVNERLKKIPMELENSPDRQAMLDRFRNSKSFANIGAAAYYRFESTAGPDGEQEYWVREKLTKHYAMIDFQEIENTCLWFDCVLNEWNASEEFNFTEVMSDNQDLATDEIDECELLKEDPMPVDTPPLTFHNDFLLETLKTSQFSPDVAMVGCWLDVNDFALKRWGLRLIGEKDDDNAKKYLSTRIGLFHGLADLSVSKLFNLKGKVKNITPDFDLSPLHTTVDGEFPQFPSNSVLQIQLVEESYLLTFLGPVAHSWKLMINDPLILLQIEREKWHLQADGLVSNLIRKGLPFEILYPSCPEGTVFYPNPGPVIHPEGKAPTHADYLAYRLDVAHFFKLYPHAHVAALCAGGILWRIAVDVLPIPAEHDLTPSFHPSACKVRMIGGQQYWTPVPCKADEETIVGVYKWPERGVIPKHDSWWPKPGSWSGSGLDFGAWAPLDEQWYQKRKNLLSGPTGRAVKQRTWKEDIKFERPHVTAFLAVITPLASEFVRIHRM